MQTLKPTKQKRAKGLNKSQKSPIINVPENSILPPSKCLEFLKKKVKITVPWRAMCRKCTEQDFANSCVYSHKFLLNLVIFAITFSVPLLPSLSHGFSFSVWFRFSSSFQPCNSLIWIPFLFPDSLPFDQAFVLSRFPFVLTRYFSYQDSIKFLSTMHFPYLKSLPFI